MSKAAGIHRLLLVLLVATSSCSNEKQDELPPDAGNSQYESNDDMPVKKLNADSSSEMPVKKLNADSTSEMPVVIPRDSATPVRNQPE